MSRPGYGAEPHGDVRGVPAAPTPFQPLKRGLKAPSCAFWSVPSRVLAPARSGAAPRLGQQIAPKACAVASWEVAARRCSGRQAAHARGGPYSLIHVIKLRKPNNHAGSSPIPIF